MARKKGGGDHGGGGGHDGGGSLRWLLTYADMITLLMAFFIMMYSMSQLDLAKFHKLAAAFRSGFGGNVQDGGGGESVVSTMPGSGGGKPLVIPELAMMPSERAVSEFKQYLESHGLSNEVNVTKTQGGLTISIVTDKVLFASGQAEINSDGRELLAELAKVLRPRSGGIRVEGHTDNLPINTHLYPSNWELSASRAAKVVRFLINQGVPPGRLSATGFADSRPVRKNDTEANRRYNRRVDLVITDQETTTPVESVRAPEAMGSKPGDRAE